MTEPAKAAVREAAVGIDWDRFLAVLARHRIEGLAHHALTAAEVALPPAQGSALARSAADILRKNLEFAAEAVRIDRAFAALPHLFVKGSTLAMLAYGTLGLKSAWDIDILMSPETIAEAGAILTDMGYICVLPAEPEQTEAWLRYVHETVWTHPTRGYAVELHSRLNDNPEMMPGVGLGSPRQRVQVGGGASLETLAQPELFAYLCAHAARHAFSRLKWLADIAAFTSVDGVSADDLHSAAERLGARRCSGTALLLADQVIGTPVDARLLARLREDPVVRGLAWTARWVMDGGRDGTASCDGAGGRMLARKASYIFLASGWRYWARELLDRAVFPYTPAYLKIPPWLRPGYTLLRMPWWLFSRRT